jgi:hypothetical protein
MIEHAQGWFRQEHAAETIPAQDGIRERNGYQAIILYTSEHN